MSWPPDAKKIGERLNALPQEIEAQTLVRDQARARRRQAERLLADTKDKLQDEERKLKKLENEFVSIRKLATMRSDEIRLAGRATP